MSDRIFDRNNVDGLRAAVHEIVWQTPVTDIHTHLYAPEFGGLLLWGIDEMLTYHYLAAEFFRVVNMPHDAFFALDKPRQAEAVWQALFVDQTPLSEACRGVLTALDRLGADVGAKDLGALRAWYAGQDARDFVGRVFEAANVRDAVMTNDPFDPRERAVWLAGGEDKPAPEIDGRFHRALRIDPLLNNWPACIEDLTSWGYRVEEELREGTVAEIQRFLEDWAARIHPLYLAVSLPPDFAYRDASPRSRLIDECVIPVTLKLNIPFALMIGVKRGVNPDLRLAGDGVDKTDLGAVEELCRRYPKNKFMLTTLSRENQHTACVIARKFRNLLPFGCWWFLNNPSLIEEMTRMRVELLGQTMIPQHSDCRVLDQLVYKWAHSREVIAEVLADQYTALVHSGWVLDEGAVRADVERMFGGNFWRFLEARF